MASPKERKKEIDCDSTKFNETMRRGKPQQQIYRPGSGPLRRSGPIDESESDTNIILRPNRSKNQSSKHSKLKSEGSSPRECNADIEQASDKLGEMSLRNFADSKKRNKKPDQSYYIPKPLAQTRENNNSNDISGNLNDSQVNEHASVNGNVHDSTERLNHQNRSKRYSHRRKPGHEVEGDDWRAPSPVNHQRNARQGSEPRTFIAHGNRESNRTRDTRSVEPAVGPARNYVNDKMHMKPPTGRRHSTIGLENDKRLKNLDSIPPRFRKKFLEENKLVSYLGTQSEEAWDGNSIVFQGTTSQAPQNSGHMPKQQNYQPQNYVDPHSVQNHHVQNQVQNLPYNNQPLYYTLQYNKPRGRGRLQQEYEPPVGGLYRCLTPDKMLYSPCNSRPPTPPSFSTRTKSNENLTKSNSRPQTPVQFYNRAEDRSNARGYDDDEQYKKSNNYYKNKHKNNEKYNSKSNHSEKFSKCEKDEVKTKDEQHTPPSRRAFPESLEALLSPVSPESPVEKEFKNPVVPVDNPILDWSEEVELQDRLEAEALSDALTRSSSVTSLLETSNVSQAQTARKPKKRNKKKNGKQRSNSKRRDRSLDNQNRPYAKNSGQDEPKTSSINQNQNFNRDRKDNFKVPESRGRRRRNSHEKRDSSFDRQRNRSKNRSREPSADRVRHNSQNEPENWRQGMRSRQNSGRESSIELELDLTKKSGIIVLPQHQFDNGRPPVLHIPTDQSVYPDCRRNTASPGQQQKSLFDPNNPHRPIIVKSSSSRISVPGFPENAEVTAPRLYTTDQYGNVRPSWYEEHSDSWNSCHYRNLLNDIKRADTELQYIVNTGHILIHWGKVVTLRHYLMESLQFLICNDLRFCESATVEQYFWKILFYNIIEMMRNYIKTDPDNKDQFKDFVNWLIDEGIKYFENLLLRLEQSYKFKLNSFLGTNNSTPQKGLGYVGLALISAQKIFLFLGDLLRYREQVNETSNYGKCRQWYIKAHEINPKNGRPYNQLAVLAVYARRKLDAVYYYMRSLMSSNPVQSARESLISLFDENRKKYEQGERKRREERLERARQHMKDKESESARGPPGSLRREIWIRPDGGRRVHRTTSAIQEHKHVDSEEEDLAALSSVEVNKRFVTSYLHVHGKLITKIGMESFSEASLQMLKEFRALLQHSPVPLPCNRFLQLLALNMFAIDSTKLKDSQLTAGYRSEWQERALVVSLQMFSLILERTVSLLQEHLNSAHENRYNLSSLPQDAHILMPAVKIWCDWMLCHSAVWNPPPSTQDYRVGPVGDAWSRLASLMNLLEKLDQSMAAVFVSKPVEDNSGHEQIRLPEDSVLSGFTPLMYSVQDPTYIPKDNDMEMAQITLRVTKLLFFGTVFLCGLEPPVLKLELESDFSEYISVVSASANRDSPPSPPELADDSDLLVESFSEDESEELSIDENARDEEIQELLTRKVELEKRQRTQELHRQRVQKILRQSVVSVHIEVRPKILITDTNCFIDYLEMIKIIATAHVYTLMVPLVVLSELEGLARGGKSPAPRGAQDPKHVLRVAESAKLALEFLSHKQTNLKCVTTKGTMLPTFTFTVEDDTTLDATLCNDDKILATCLVVCKGNKDQQAEGAGAEPRKLYREVVLLTDDRNLRVKALARDVPVRELPDFLQWAGLG